MDKLSPYHTVTYCCIMTFITTIFFLFLTGLSVYTFASFFSGSVVALLNIIEDEIIHKQIYK